MRLAVWVVPWVYHLHMAVVWATSRVRVVGVDEAVALGTARGGSVFAVYHETVLPTLYRGRHYKLMTVASQSDSGEVISAVIKHLGLSVVRGGSSRSKRRRTPVVKAMIDHMRANPGTVTAITVDGSSGPRRKLKPGALELARATGSPLYAVHAHATFAIRLPSWDRTIVPLPFGCIRIVALGPVEIPAQTTAGEFDALKARVQSLLDEAAERTERGDMA